MKDEIGWDELRIFLAVARAEGLAGAARSTSLSAPTLGRRMNALEAALDRKLFDRSQTGYALTDSGRELYLHAIEMEQVAAEMERWRDRNARRIVRISAGSWTSRYLARNIAALIGPDEPIGIDLATAHATVDIGRRHADIGIRARPPQDPRLVGRRVQSVAHAVYRGRSATREDEPWIGVTGDAAITQSARWISARNTAGAALLCSDARVVVDYLAAGRGRAILPCFAGDAEPEIVRVGTPVEELRGEQWLVLNDAARREPPVRTVIDRLVKLLENDRALFEAA